MINTAELEVLAEELRVYDVDQGGWEQEPNGFEANAGHVLTHLAGDLVGKNFDDEHLIRTTIAPDSVQYGIRLARWAGISIADVAKVGHAEEHIREIVEASFNFRKLPLGFASFAGAMQTLATHLHDTGHGATKEKAIRNRQAAMRTASRLLVRSADVQAHHFGFSLPIAFDTRLSYLRTRSNIPHPRATSQSGTTNTAAR